MKVCHIITRLIIGGAQENTVLTCEGLAAKGHDVTLLAGPETGPEGSLWPRAEQGDYRCVTIESMRRNIDPMMEFRCLVDMRRHLAAEKYDIVHTHSSKAGIIGRQAAMQAGVPIVVHTIHGMSFNRTQGKLIRTLYQSLERRAGRQSQAIITVADAMIEQSVAAEIAPRDKFVTIRSGIETDRFVPDSSVREQVRRQWGVQDEDIVIGTVARLFENKGYEDILQIMPLVARACPQARFVWVGNGAHRDKYLSQVEQMGLRDRLHLTGLVPPDQVPALLNGFDILVHASRWEGLPRAVVQALLMRVPVVSYDNDGAPEVVKQDLTGELVPFNSPEGLAEAILRLTADPPTRARLGANGRDLCLIEFDHRRMVNQIDDLYGRLAV